AAETTGQATFAGCTPALPAVAARRSLLAASLLAGVWILLRRRRRAQHDTLNLPACALDQLAHLALVLAEPPEHVGRDYLRVGRVGTPHADPHAPELSAAQLALDRLEPVVTGQPASDPGSHLPKRQVDLVVHHHHPLERQLECSPRRTYRPPSLVHVGLGTQHRDPRTRRRGRPAWVAGARAHVDRAV